MNPTQKPPPFSPAADPRDEEAAARTVIAAANWWPSAGLTEHWPATTAAATRLLYLSGEFDIEAGRLEDLIARGLMPAPARDEDGRFEWSGTDIFAAVRLLESRRQWLPQSAHDSKKSAWRLGLEHLRASGDMTPPPNLPRLDLRHCLLMLAVCPDPEGREKILAGLMAVLECDHGIVI